MPTTSNKSGPTNVELTRVFRDRIVRGVYPPGSRLPSRTTIRHDFASTAATIQRAFDRLKRDGFIVPRGRLGTFVNDAPPHLCHYGLVFDSVGPSARARPMFWTALQRQAEQYPRDTDGNARFLIFHRPHGAATVEQFQQLNDLVEADRLAGLIFVSAPDSFAGSPVLDRQGIPRLLISRRPIRHPLASIVLHGFIERSLDHLRARGCRRVCLLVAPSLVALDAFTAQVEQRGMSTRPIWQQAVDHTCDPRWTRHLVELIFSAARDARPDGLIIADDNVVPDATETLAGLDDSEALTVVGHANFPWPTPAHLPIHRIGYDIDQVLNQAVRAIDAALRGGSPLPEQVVIEAGEQARRTGPIRRRR